MELSKQLTYRFLIFLYTSKNIRVFSPGFPLFYRFIFSSLLGILIFSFGSAQTTKIRGTITDAESGEPLPFVNISFTGKPIGTISDFNGTYYIETLNPSDSLRISYLGFKAQSYPVRIGIFQTIDAVLERDHIAIEEVVVHPGENPAHPILRNVLRNKGKNNPRNLDSYFFETYNKIQVDINNVDEQFKDQVILRPFQFTFQYTDTSAITGKPYLPVMLSEAISDYYYRKSPFEEKEIIKASKVSGINNESLSQVTGNIFQDLNIYDNYLKVADQGFVSPISDFALLYYKYYLVDSAYINDRWCYELSFQPRRKQEPTFTGNFWVHDTTFAVVKIQLRLADEVNVNFIHDIAGEEEYQMINDSLWFLKQQKLFVDFNLRDQATGFFGRKLTTYGKVRINEPFPPEAAAIRDKVWVPRSALRKNENFWENNRPVPLTTKENNIYSMVDSVQSLPEYIRLEKLIEMFVTGYWVQGLIELGPYYTFYSYNEIEGKRFKFGARTSNQFSTNLMIEGHIAYGIRDERLKYRGGFLYLFNKNPRVGFAMHYKHDIEQIGESPNAFLNDNFFATYLRRNPNYKLTLVDDFTAYYEKEWIQGFSNTLTFNHKRIFATQYIPFILPEDTGGLFLPKIVNSELSLNTRYAKGERYIMGEFLRTSIGTRNPVLNLDIAVGLRNVLNSEYDYLKIKFSISQKVPFHPLGYFRYNLEMGKLFGTLPYPLLHLHEGNETYLFDRYSFNMMNYYEFASDQYISLFLEHHFQGLLFNKLPLLRRLKWREVASARGVIGSLESRHELRMPFPEGLNSLAGPYLETSLGIENILKFFRVDAMWRLTHRDNPDIQTFGIRGRFQFIF